ncbi:AAA family ATPase [Agromyces sp. NPDC057679]|uniref:AAA family ATPase n=1 Tax=Agromyces sp. NPDC057679 TaxID=3346207 RepID=UPI00366A9CE4
MTTHSGWRAGAITAPLNDNLQKHISELESRFPIVRQHRRALGELGSQMVHAQKCSVNGLQNCRISLVRFSGAIEAAFGLTREVMFFYSPYPDLQIRELKAAKDAIRKLHRDVTPDVIFVSSPDPRARQKLDDWSTGGFLAIPLSGVDATDPVSLVSLLRDYIYARDLFYESTPVRGDRFFGRRQLMQALHDDVRKQRVAGLFGLRKAGKTSVLSQLADDVSNDDRIVILRDLESLPSPPTDPIPSLIKDLRADLMEVLKRRGHSSRALGQLQGTADASDFRRAMQTVLRSLAKENVSLVLLLDEIEYLTPSDRIDISEGEMASVSQFLGALRSLVQENDNFTFVLSGLTSAIVENGRLFGRPNPLFSWAKSHFLAPFDRAEADELATSVGSRMGINIDSGALESFFEATGGHAFLYRSLASSVVQQLPVDVFQRRISRADVLRNLDDWKRTVAGNIHEMVSHVRRYYPLEAVMLDMLMESPDDFGDIAKEQPLELQHLLSLGLIEKDGTSYQSATVLSLL